MNQIARGDDHGKARHQEDHAGVTYDELKALHNDWKASREKKTKAPQQYKDKAAEQIAILQKDKGELCMDKGAPAPGDDDEAEKK